MPKKEVELDPTKWPAWYYGPDNQSKVFASPDEVPDGWKDSPAKLKQKRKTAAKKPAAKRTSKATEEKPDEEIPFSRDELEAHLKELDIEFAADATDKVLYDQLLEVV